MSISGPDARVRELDVLRGLAAAAVVLFHYTVRYGALYGYPAPPIVRVPTGFYGVEVFFCISGFVIFMTLDRTRRPMDFVVSRVSRLWPAYIVAIAVTFAVVRGFVMNHMIHHRAQLGVYLRLNNLPVPAIYGPSADEGSF